MVARAAPRRWPEVPPVTREVEHLTGEDGGSEDAHDGHLTLAQIAVDAAQADADDNDGNDPKDDGNGDGKEAIGDVHG